MIKRIFIIALLSVLIFGGLFGYKFYQINQAMTHVQLPPPLVVAASEVKQEQWLVSLSAVGSLTAVAGVNVSNEVTGKIKAIHFESGQAVKQGQLLVELDAATDQAELKGLLAEQQLAQVRFNRGEKMLDKKFISSADYDQNQASLQQAIAAVAAKRTLIDKKQIRAPFNGELGIRQVDLGQYLAPGTAIVSLQKLDPIYLDFNLPERHISHLSKGQTITATVQAYPEQSFGGEIIAISPAIEANSRAIKVRAALNNHDKRLHPGMFAQVQISSGQQNTVLTLPDTAITYNPYGNSVFLIQNTDKGYIVQNRQVETGLSKAGRVEVISGLNVGDKVVSAGQVKLRNGIPVTIDTQPAPGERE